MAPFGVKVVTGMVAMVESHFHDNLADVVVPEGSMYKPAEKWIKMAQEPGQGAMKDKEMPLEVFAERFVSDLLAGKSGKVWRGGMATIGWLASWLFPGFLVVSYLPAHNRLELMSRQCEVGVR